jgi:hypothetical protein
MADGADPRRTHLSWGDATLLICAGRLPQPAVDEGLCGGAGLVVGGAWAWLVVVVGCTRALSLISVLGPEHFRAGDMMVGGVIPLGYALRPLGL